MSMAMPVIVTNYSGPGDFISQETAFPGELTIFQLHSAIILADRNFTIEIEQCS
jgi:hypothetical protein